MRDQENRVYRLQANTGKDQLYFWFNLTVIFIRTQIVTFGVTSLSNLQRMVRIPLSCYFHRRFLSRLFEHQNISYARLLSNNLNKLGQNRWLDNRLAKCLFLISFIGFSLVSSASWRTPAILPSQFFLLWCSQNNVANSNLCKCFQLWYNNFILCANFWLHRFVKSGYTKPTIRPDSHVHFCG